MPLSYLCGVFQSSNTMRDDRIIKLLKFLFLIASVVLAVFIVARMSG